MRVVQMQTSDASRRENAISCQRPTLSTSSRTSDLSAVAQRAKAEAQIRDPYRVMSGVKKKDEQRLCHKLLSVVMGPRFRGDDEMMGTCVRWQATRPPQFEERKCVGWAK